MTDTTPGGTGPHRSGPTETVEAMRQPGQRRVYLAAERTLLTWVRTAATLMVPGAHVSSSLSV